MKKLFKVLVIEDDPNIAELISLYIEKEGFSIEIAWDGEEGLGKYYEVSPDFVILDIMLPGMDGFEICKEIRRDKSGIPIIMLTGKGESYDKIRGFGLGVDDYMVKPFDPNELIARVKAVLRRSNPSSLHEVVNIPGITINMNEYKVYVNNAEITMPPKELELLYFFVVNKNQVFTRQQLLDNIWGYDYDGDSRTIDVHIKRIREKLEEQSERWNLRTIRGIGYKLEVKESD